ncbi:MAG: tRNA (adenosine(37)-N6)-threonylcarbamoyltransferase complex ATPase subunit type 1 TsaE [Synechococcaceae cyanobacterium SM2_3_2]|nr:tRNA (adenosine(37)-N6)-threonylcarbamoyltransferase complex ATPase subunit type 1 TsaE [Synechococcaceae cyanobacterium SM2_3_2]
MMMGEATAQQTVIWADRQAMTALATALAIEAEPGTILLLEGDLGSGKTTLVQDLARGLGIPEVVSSPTFVLVQVYEEGRIPLIHADLYRLSSADPEELELWDPRAITAIEWPDRLMEEPEDWLRLQLTILPDDRRRVTASWQGANPGAWWQRVQQTLGPPIDGSKQNTIRT